MVNNPVTRDVIAQYKRSFKIIRSEIEAFSDEQWSKGLDFFLTPVNVAMHITDTLDFYFSSGITGEKYRWGHRFGGGWWEMAEDKKPSRDAVLAYLDELEKKIMAQLNDLNDQALSQMVPREDNPTTLIGHLMYAIRHTMHHHGELGALSVYHGNEGGVWDDRV